MLKFGRTLSYINEYNIDLGKIETIDLMGYKDFVKFMQDSLFIISDSGTAQEEPALLKIPVVVPREFTERPESVQNNNSIMFNLEKSEYEETLNWATKKYSGTSDWLGEGKASDKIISFLKENL